MTALMSQQGVVRRPTMRKQPCHTFRSSCSTRKAQRAQRLPARATAAVDAPSTSGSKETDFQQAIGILKQAADKRTAPPNLVLEAMMKLEKQRLATDSYADIIGGGKEGRRWQLVFVSGSKDVQKANKGQPSGGKYNPITAAQWWSKDTGIIENGVYLGPIAALVFHGPYEYAKNKLTFDFTKLKLRLGPKWFEFSLGSMDKFQQKSKGKPFFLLAYADDNLVVAKGKGGGIALWARTSAEWEMKNLRG